MSVLETMVRGILPNMTRSHCARAVLIPYSMPRALCRNFKRTRIMCWEGRKVQNTPDSFLLTEHSAVSNTFIVSDFFPSPSVWCEITAPLSIRCIFRFALPAVTHCFYQAFCHLHSSLVQPFKTLAPVRDELCSFLFRLYGSSIKQSARSYSLLTWLRDLGPMVQKAAMDLNTEYCTTYLLSQRNVHAWTLEGSRIADFSSQQSHMIHFLVVGVWLDGSVRRKNPPVSTWVRSSQIFIFDSRSHLFQLYPKKKCLAVPCLLLSTKWCFVPSSTHLWGTNQCSQIKWGWMDGWRDGRTVPRQCGCRFVWLASLHAS